MNSRLLVLVAGLSCSLAGCANSTLSEERHSPYVKPGLIMLTADQAERRGLVVHRPPMDKAAPTSSTLEPLDSSAVIAPPGVKVYTMNRMVDPSDSELMHEEHVVYRRETTPVWRLQAPAGQKLLVGPRVTDGRQALQPLLDQELTSFLADERRATEANQKAIAALFKAVDALNRQHEALAQELGKISRDANAPPANDKAQGDSPLQSPP